MNEPFLVAIRSIRRRLFRSDVCIKSGTQQAISGEEKGDSPGIDRATRKMQVSGVQTQHGGRFRRFSV